MRLITIPIIIIIILILLAIFTPVLLIRVTEPLDEYVDSMPDIRCSAGEILAGISSFLGRYDTTINLYDYLITEKPDLAEYYGKKAYYLHLMGNLEEALSTLDGAIARDPENPDYLLRKARISRSLNKLSEAEEAYEKIDAISPKDAHESVICGDAALDRSMYLQAYTLYNNALRSNPSDASTWEKQADVIFALLTIYPAGLHADKTMKNRDIYSEGIKSYNNALHLNPSRTSEIKEKIQKRSEIYIPSTIAELESRYTTYRFLR